MLYQLSYLPAHSCTYVTITHSALPVNGVPRARRAFVPSVSRLTWSLLGAEVVNEFSRTGLMS